MKDHSFYLTGLPEKKEDSDKNVVGVGIKRANDGYFPYFFLPGCVL